MNRLDYIVFLIDFLFNNIIKGRVSHMATVVDFFTDVQNFKLFDMCYTGANAYAAVMLLVLGTVIFVLNKTTGDYSWVDRIWSLLPISFAVYLLYFQTHCDKLPISARQTIMFVFILLWGLRLTFNFYRKGGYTASGEDYRWAYIRKNFPVMMVELLNFFFTSYYQLYLIYWFSSPIYYASNPGLGLTDIVLAALWLVLFAGEVTADEQQWSFQKQKYRMLKQNGNTLANLPQMYKKGFITDGLFKFSRHPNFFCEICMWWTMYLFSVSSQGFNLSGGGALLLNLLFLGSTALTEKISCEKYPLYKQYQKQVSMLIPGPPSTGKSKSDSKSQ